MIRQRARSFDGAAYRGRASYVSPIFVAIKKIER